MPFPHVFSPVQLRHKTLSNRITFGAHTANMSDGGLPGDRHVAYYRERAIGGAAMIVVEPVPVHRTAVLTRGNFRHDDDAVIPAFRRLVEACREVSPDIVMIQQLYHVGEHGDADNSFAPNWTASARPSYHDADGSHEMTASEIEEIVDGFVAAAGRAQQAGYDGIELFAAYHALVDQFWTPWSNRRTDEWGGSFENRMRLSSTILSRIRERCSEDFIIGLAVSVDDTSGVTLSVEELQAVVAWHDDRLLMDYVTCGTGSYVNFYEIIPTSLYRQQLGVPYAAALKQVVQHALVQAESHIRTPQAAEEALADGSADLVSIVRGQIADPYLVAKARDDRADEVRPCISCNQLCWGRRSRDYWISCLVNPSAGREFEWGGEPFAPATEPKHVLVVGGGPAGLETARVAASRGHRVTLVERGARLGGQFRLAGLQPSREQIGDVLAWFGRELARLGVELRLDTELDAAGVREIGADVVVIATGARPSRDGFQRAAPAVDRLAGVDGEDVFAIHDVLDGTAKLGSRVIVLDDLGDWRGTGTALHLAENGHEVTIVTAAPVIAAGLAHSAADGPLRRRFLAAGGTALTNTVVDGWSGGKAQIRFLLDGGTFEFEADALVIAETARSETTLPNALTEAGIAFEAIGDVVAPRRASLAFYEARELACRL